MIFFERHKIKFGRLKRTSVDSNTLMLNEENVELNKINSLERKNEFIGIRQLRNELIPNKPIFYNSNGKPFVDKCDNHISVSHSSKSICLAISRFPLGIDIEGIDERVLRIKTKYVNIEDKKHYQYNSVEDLTILWTIKECLYKLHDIKGLSFKNDIRALSRNKNDHYFEVQTKNGIQKHLLIHEKIDNEILTYNIE